MPFSTSKLFGMTIRESATDGSDFTNPDADYRRLFLGEDGYLHVKDSAGAVADPYPAGSSVSTDSIWDAAGDLAVGSGANTAAKLTAGAAGGVLAMGNSAVIWNAGTSFPANKATGDRYFRTDLGLEFYWDGTRWVSTTLYTAQIAAQRALMPFAATSYFNAAWPAPGYDIYVYTLIFSSFVITTNDGTKYWTAALDPGSATVASTVSNSPDAWVLETAALDVVLDAATYKVLSITLTKVSTAGSLYCGVGITYRIIAT